MIVKENVNYFKDNVFLLEIKVFTYTKHQVLEFITCDYQRSEFAANFASVRTQAKKRLFILPTCIKATWQSTTDAFLVSIMLDQPNHQYLRSMVTIKLHIIREDDGL